MALPLLAIPPFPGSRAPSLAVPQPPVKLDAAMVLKALADARVGGCYWGAQPVLPDAPYVLDGTATPVAGAQLWRAGDDPWHVLAGAQLVRLALDDARLLLALAAGVAVQPVGAGGAVLDAGAVDVEGLLARHLGGWSWRDPFSGVEIDLMQAIALCGAWRRLIDANRPLRAALGFAFWKRPSVGPLLWGGGAVRFANGTAGLGAGDRVAVWRTRMRRGQAEVLAARGVAMVEVEDGFIRSSGLGADCVPPLSIIVDPDGVHFDPTRPSGLESLLEHGAFPDELCARAAALRARIVMHGISKYERGGGVALPRPGGARRHVLVPGQVEDDRAVTSGGALSSNLELLRRARAAAPDAFIIYKPHPDVLAGHRRGAIAEGQMRALADRVETDAPMAGLIDMVDELHVNSSLAGFEALLRGKAVSVHGVPFYAGWGLTHDLGDVPARRTARRSLDELVAATLILYPRYLDPVTGLPCPAEVLVERLAAGATLELDHMGALAVRVRRLQGRLLSLLPGPWRTRLGR